MGAVNRRAFNALGDNAAEAAYTLALAPKIESKFIVVKSDNRKESECERRQATLTSAACFTPRRTGVWMIQSAIEAPITDWMLFPFPNTGKKKATELKIATA